MSLPRVWINGAENTKICVFDRGLSYGDGFFTTALVVNGKWLNAEAHLWRIQTGCHRLQLPLVNEDVLLRQVKDSLAQLGSKPSELLVLKLMITRGQGGRGYQLPEECTPTIIVQWMSSPATLDLPEPLRLLQLQTPLSVNPLIAGLKHLNRLENVLAKSELANTVFADGLMENAFGRVVCSSQANLFALQGDKLLTPKMHDSGVHGTVRFALQKLSNELGYQWIEQDFTWSELLQVDALFLSNAIRGIMPIASLQLAEGDEHQYDSRYQAKVSAIAESFNAYQLTKAIDLTEITGNN
ncbi:aminodeoxychorismate lyase [Thiomicrorhabdus sp. 6S2-11]|uniref:Aminodeoxychorismate lyase n=1 Tax=Thiomicrorhabdus marina TaxID=2818442 RepID=A0ABS3Q708_9GAMM|nr:aminodeoxychorismate lyase [Thiomicrorhabdus marina]MBO1928144.1 aminodeoxychorismate lyase [Thiomicrorhabdus marina]